MAASVCVPFVAVAVLQERVYGLVVTSAPNAVPSRRNCTPATTTLSVEVAIMVIVPDTEEPVGGAVIVTVGEVVSAMAVPLASFDAALKFPVASFASTR